MSRTDPQTAAREFSQTAGVSAQAQDRDGRRTVFKYPIPISDVVSVCMPQGARILTVQAQRNSVCVWALVDPDAPEEIRRLGIYGTGNPFLGGLYINTFQMHDGALVWHAFDLSGVAQ